MTRKNILITGASSGLGAQMARDFAALGRNLALSARRLDRLEELRTDLLTKHPGITVSVRALDVNDHQQVFDVFKGFRADLGSLDRVIVNAGLGKGQPIGKGRFDANLETAQTNFVAALAQCEAAMEIFRDQNAGHLVMISSMSAMRGFPRNLTTYAATKAGAAALAEGIRAEMIGKPIKVTTLFPGYIRTELNEHVANAPMMASTEKGVRSMVRAIESERATASVPAWPWAVLGPVLRFGPLRLIAKAAG
jgi:short-subunit dehydrogenase